LPFPEILVKKTLLEPEEMIDVDPADPGEKNIHPLPWTDFKFIQRSLIRIKHLNPSLKINIIIHGIDYGWPDHILVPLSFVHQVFIIGMKQKAEMIVQSMLKKKISPYLHIGLFQILGNCRFTLKSGE
jgi:hypothetical protein